ncbi:MAG: hypothetical protein J6Q45_01370 [Alistipes sp.]|nr:hypothetical protein [Alistipes sp.]
MIKSKITIASLMFAAFSIVESAAQDILPRVAGLEGDKAYMELLRSDEKMRQQTDSLQGVVREIRMEMSKNNESKDENFQARADSLFVVLSNTENAVYALRTKRVKLIDQISTIEQNYVLSNVGNIGGAQSAQGSKSLFNNSYLKESLNPEDYKLLLDANKKEAKAFEYAQTYVRNYSKIKNLYDQYLMEQEEAEAEKIYAELSEAMAENLISERMLGDSWNEVFDNKNYAYSYFLEKENRIDLLELAEGMMNEVQQEKLSAMESCMSESVMNYCLQKPIALTYELYVAKLLNLPAAIDSLTIAARNVRSIDYRMPLIDIERRSFVNYEPIEFSSRSPYNSTNPIPDNVVYEYGTIYRILVGTFKYRQQPSIFRGASPLYVEAREDGRFSYYVGGLRTRDEAESAVEVMKKKGFRDPQIVEWCDGIKTNLSKEEDGERITYRISITNGSLSDMVREVISTMAEGCQLSRLAEDNFLVSSFASRAVAERVANAISKCDEILKVEVQEVKPEPQSEEEE